MNSKAVNAIVSWIAILGGLSSIIGIIIALCSEKDKAIIALISIIVFLVAFLFMLWYYVSNIIHKEYDRDFLKLSYFIKYEFLDKTHIVYDGYRLIQSKRIFLPEIKWAFKWTGTTTPKISSTLQQCDGKIHKGSHPGDYDHSILRFNKALFYNESAVVHFHAEMDDSDGSSQPVLEVKVDEPVSVIDFRAVLSYKDANCEEQAEFKRKPIHDNGYGTQYQTQATVNFNKHSKSYEYVLPNPEVGYFYRLEWEK